jgi:NAD(P)-dependent dehydrogenase (short-subunit alcohol dehydrogenase family)
MRDRAAFVGAGKLTVGEKRDFIHMDVGDENSVSDGFFKAAASIGKLDIVVNNAGIGDVASR